MSTRLSAAQDTSEPSSPVSLIDDIDDDGPVSTDFNNETNGGTSPDPLLTYEWGITNVTLSSNKRILL